MYDFDSITTSQVTLPYRDRPYLRTTYSDPHLAGYEATVVEDTRLDLPENMGDEGVRCLTLITRFPRCILPEVNTHRVVSKNSASSRARSVKTTIGAVMRDPYVPLFTSNQKGMSGGFLTGRKRDAAEARWLAGRDLAVSTELSLLTGKPLDPDLYLDWEGRLDSYYKDVYQADTPGPHALSVHKQNANRVIEPYMWHEALLTSTMWENFINLRTDLATAQPEIVALARLIQAALRESTPDTSWIHLPFAKNRPQETTDFASLRGELMLAATQCAQISYRDKSTATASTATTALGERLLSSGHMSPFEHVAFDARKYAEFTDEDLPRDAQRLRSNLGDEWVQLRHALTR